MLVKTWILKYLRTNETRYIKWQKTCNVNANWMQVFVTTNKDRMKINADVCECICYILCDVVEYLDYKICKCQKRLVDRLVKECIENIDEK